MSDKPSSVRMPRGIAFLVGNEGVERYTYYAMRTVLITFLTKCLVDAQGHPANMSAAYAKEVYHLFASANYFFPILGSILADVLIGKYLTVMSLSLVYVVGCVVLALFPTHYGVYIGLGLIALGSGGIKPCMMAMVGDQFNKSNEGLLGRGTRYFYLSIQVGGFLSTLVSPLMLKYFGSRVAFGIPAILMALATLIFWLGRNSFVKVPADAKSFKQEVLTKAGLAAVVRLSGLLFFMVAFFSLYDQTGSSWVLQAAKMDLKFAGVTWLETQLQVLNPLLLIFMVPLFDRVVYPAVDRVVKLTALRKMGFGLFLLIPTFLLGALVQVWIDAGQTPSIAWQLLQYVLLTTGELLAYSTALEFFYTQAPPRMKSVVQGFFMLSVSLGNFFTAGVNWCIEKLPSFKTSLAGPNYFIFFAGFMTVMTIGFIVVAMFYQEKMYLQETPKAAVEA